MTRGDALETLKPYAVAGAQDLSSEVAIRAAFGMALLAILRGDTKIDVERFIEAQDILLATRRN